MEIEGWEQFKGRLPKSHEWICVGAVKGKDMNGYVQEQLRKRRKEDLRRDSQLELERTGGRRDGKYWKKKRKGQF